MLSGGCSARRKRINKNSLLAGVRAAASQPKNHCHAQRARLRRRPFFVVRLSTKRTGIFIYALSCNYNECSTFLCFLAAPLLSFNLHTLINFFVFYPYLVLIYAQQSFSVYALCMYVSVCVCACMHNKGLYAINTRKWAHWIYVYPTKLKVNPRAAAI